MKRSILSAAILGAFCLGTTLAASAEVVDLCAGAFNKDLTPNNTNDAVEAPMWGYALGGATNGECVGELSSPGPRIEVAVGETSLTINLTNTLPRATSLVIPGTVKAMAPVYFTGPGGLQRVRAFDAEAAPGGTQVYTWANPEPGSYLYHSGSHPAVQVQMGLYGALTQDSAAGEAYPGVTYSNEAILFYSEVDPAMHAAIDGGAHTQADMASTIDYAPKYFFIDVDGSTGPASYEASDLPPSITLATGDTLIRFYNAGLKMHIPTAFGASFGIVAEDGKQYPNVREQYSVELSPLKTRDALLSVNAPGGTTFRLSDSAMAVSNPDQSPIVVAALGSGNGIANGNANGMVLDITVQPEAGYIAPSAPSRTAPVAIQDNLTVAEGGSIDDLLALAMANDINSRSATASISSYPSHGELVYSNGSYQYLHGGGERVSDSLVYALTNAAGERSSGGIVINVIPSNDPPEAFDDTVEVSVGQTVEIRALQNDKDVDSANLVVSSVDASSLGALSALDQVIVFEAAQAGAEDVNYVIADGDGGSATAVLHLSVLEAAADPADFGAGAPAAGGSEGSSAGTGGSSPTAADDAFSVMSGQSIDITNSEILSVLANDSDGATVDTNLLVYPLHGSIQMFENGTFVYTHDGSDATSDSFIYEVYNQSGTSSGTVTIQVLKPVARGDRG